MVLDRDADAAATVAKEIGDARSIPVDLSDLAAIDALDVEPTSS